MLFIDDDEPEIGNRREDCRTRADHDIHRAASDFTPLGPTLGSRQSAVKQTDFIGEPGVQAVQKLWG